MTSRKVRKVSSRGDVHGRELEVVVEELRNCFRVLVETKYILNFHIFSLRDEIGFFAFFFFHIYLLISYLDMFFFFIF